MNNQSKICSLRFKIREGFTLIELLVVISLLSILTSFVLSNIVDTRQRSRDAQRKSDLTKIAAALEAYKADFGMYPQRGDGLLCSSSAANCTIRAAYLSETNASSLSRYILEIPKDPGRTVTGNTCDTSGAGTLDYVYRYNASSQKYILFAKLENATTDPDAVKLKVAPAELGLDAALDTCLNPGTGTCKAYKIGAGSCTGVTFNYWTVNP